MTKASLLFGLFFLLSGSIAAADTTNKIKLAPGQSTKVAGVNIEVTESEKTPLREEICINKDKFDRCTASNIAFHFEGASCTEECLELDNFNKCKIRNRCTFDKASGCFKKKTCLEVAAFGKCNEWQDSVACD
jgi:hypothetical protein